MREKLHLTQKEVADKARIAESAYHAYERSDRNPKLEILGRIAKALGVRSECLSAPTFNNHYEFAYALLENEDTFGYTIREIEGAPAIATGHEPGINFFVEFINDWIETHKKLESREISQEEYKKWKHTWNNNTYIIADDSKSLYKRKQQMLIHIENFRNINIFDYEIEDGKINYLYGICGSGKSSIVDAVTQEARPIDARIGCSEDEMLVSIDGQKSILSNSRTFNENEQQALFSQTATPGIYEIFIGSEEELNKLEDYFNDSVTKLRTHLDSMYAFQGRISELQKALGKPGVKGAFTPGSKISKAAHVSQNSTPFMKSAVSKGGLDYVHWLNEGRTITSDFQDGTCPFCGVELTDEQVKDISILESIRAADLKPLFAQSTLLENFKIDKSLLESEGGERDVKQRLIELYDASKELGKVIAYCNTPKTSLLDTGIPKLKVDEKLYLEFPTLKEPVEDIQSNSENMNKLLGEMKRTFSSLIKSNVNELNIQLKKLSIPYRFSINEANREGKTADYVLAHINAQDNADMKTALSTGEKNLVSLLLFLHRKDGSVLFIDDPASSFDDYRRTQIFNLIQKVQGKTVLVVSHDQAFIKRAVRERRNERIGKIQEIYQDSTKTVVKDISASDYVFLPDRISSRISESLSLRQLFINLRLLCDLRRATLSEPAWGYISMHLHKKTQSEISDALNDAGVTEKEVLNEISSVTGCSAESMSSLKSEDQKAMSDFERLIEARESIDPSMGAELKAYKEMLNDLVHMNDALAYCLDPYEFHVWPSMLDSLLGDK